MHWTSVQQCLAGRHQRSGELTSAAIEPSQQEKMARNISCRHRRRELTSTIALKGIKASKADEAIRAAADIEEKELTSDMADKAIRRTADIEAKYLASAMADEAIKEPDAFIMQAPSSQRNGFSQLILPSLGSSFALRHQHQVWQVHQRFLRHLCLLLHLLPLHHAPRPPPARAAHLHCGSCGLLCGHQIQQLLVHLPGHHLSLLLSAPKSQRFLRFAIAMPIADPRNRAISGTRESNAELRFKSAMESR